MSATFAEPGHSGTPAPRPVVSHRELTAAAGWVLGRNDNGQMITAAPSLYPHMWSWDAAFISVGLAHLSVDRAARELRTLFRAQWRDGMLPHIVFDPGSDGYFPGPQRWEAHLLARHAPRTPQTSGICQPPVHAIALRSVVDTARASGRSDDRRAGEALLRQLWPDVFRWHEWLATHRDTGGTGLLAIVHSWESGMDNSHRWDLPYQAVRPQPSLPPFTRLDRAVVADGAQRPSDAEYQRYLWLIEEMRAVRYDATAVVDASSFLVADVFVSAVFALASDVLAELGEECGQPPEQIAQLRAWATRGRTAVAGTVDTDSGLASDHDLRSGRWLATQTFAGFAPLLSGGLTDDAELAMLTLLDGPAWAGHPELVAALPPSTSPVDPDFRPREYWRGPLWPVVTWLLWWSMRRRGWHGRAAALRDAGLSLVSDGTFAEYYHPATGQPLGSRHQSWTAAVTLDWLQAA